MVAALGRLLRRRHAVSTVDVLRERLEHFRDLVEKNNQVLEIIAGAGEMLGGEYIFDVQYLRSIAGDLHDACHAIIDDLNAVCGGRYRKLLAILKRIDLELQAILECRMVVGATDYVIPLDRIDEGMTDTVGAKMARLGALRRHLGCRVPDGFVISTFACQYLLEETGIGDEVERLFAAPGPLDEATLSKRARRLQERVMNARLPRDLVRAIERAAIAFSRRNACATLAVRSSALGEDSELSFAGQFRTVLGVPARDVVAAYREVIASLYSASVMEYRRSRGMHPARGLMAVGCLCMVPSRAGGVLYTLDPLKPARNNLVVSVALGLGKTVVDGSHPVDRFEVARTTPHQVEQRAIAAKQSMLVVAANRGVEAIGLTPQEQQAAAVTDGELADLADIALAIEKHMRCAVDIEWAIDREGRISLLQARPLRISPAAPVERDLTEIEGRYQVLMRGKGSVACSGVGSGPVRLVADEDSYEDIPRDTVLVARTSTPRLSSAIARASAVITDVGTTTGHLATIAREFRVPAILDTQDATRILADGDVVTVDADANVVFAGRVDELLHNQLLRSSTFEDTAEFRMLRRMLKRIAPLNLRDPLSRGFTEANCSTYHDIIRFAHEMAVQELAEGHWVEPSQRSRWVRTLDLPVPLDLVVVDLGGGLTPVEGRRRVSMDAVVSQPLRALLAGLTAEGVWATDPARMDANAFMASATRAAPWLTSMSARPQHNLAIISSNYFNLNLHLGFHFNIVDCYLSDSRNDNYIYFRFTGGVTELTRRSRRASLLRQILEHHDFLVESKGDLVTARLKKIPREPMLERLEMIGKLIGFTRQLDILLCDEETVERYVARFLDGKYGGF
jgi:pyruvate, water dikinase